MQSLEQTCYCVQQEKKRRNNWIDGEADWVLELKGMMPQSDILLRTTRGIQQTLFAPQGPSHLEVPVEPKGVVYTKRWVVELLLDLAGYRSEANLVDSVAVEPAAGDGAFLGPMIERLAESCLKLGRPFVDCRNSVVAYELDEESADRARTLAANVLIHYGATSAVARSLATGWVRTGDYLFDATSIDADFVIGNPPYIRLEEIPENAAALYRKAYGTMRGRADLYVAFFEAALQQLRRGGVCAFICADRWMRNQYGAELRELITSAYGVEVVVEMHNADAFDDEVDAYPAITVIRRQPQRGTVVASAGPEAQNLSSRTMSDALQATGRREPAEPLPGLRTALVDTWFKGSDPWPCHSPEQLALLRRLEDRFPKLESYAKVGIGVATGNDKVFVTRNATLVESSQLLRLAMAKDIGTGTLQWSGHYLVDPWNCDGLVELSKFPRLRAYLEEHGDALRKRHTAIKNAEGWYKTIDRVTHSFASKRKLYIADIKSVLDPVLDRGETYPHHNLYFIESDVWDLEILGGLLMSAVGQFFVESYGVRMRGGYWRFQAQYLRRIRVPDPNSLSSTQTDDLREAFRQRNRKLASRAAFDIYGIDEREMDIALGRR
jgi:adenine-specific DNA-methyltransferase